MFRWPNSAVKAATLLAAAIVSVWATPSAAQAGPIATAKQVTASYTFDLTPSPKGTAAVMIRIIGGREQLFAYDMTSGAETQLTHDDADHEDPAWSPDGKRIAFVLVTGDRKVVHLMDADGRNRIAITPSTQSAIHPSFSADGSEILYCTDDDLRPPAKNESEIYAININTLARRTVVSEGVNTFPVMSPDGKKIAYRKIIGDMNSEVFVADADGSNPRNITNHFSYEGWPAWSPDGSTIAFSGNRNGAWQIFLVEPDGKNQRLLSATEGRGTSPKWSSDGSLVFYTVCRSSQERRGCDIYMAAARAERSLLKGKVDG